MLKHEKASKYFDQDCSTYEWPNHVVNNYNSLTAVDSFYKIVLRKIGYHYLPRIYIPYPDNLPKTINGIRTVSTQRMICLFRSFSGAMTELKQIFNDKHCMGNTGVL